MSTHADHRTTIEKIVARHAAGWHESRPPRAGDYVRIRPRHVMTHDNTSAVIPKFHALAGRDAQVHDSTQPVFAMDHDIQNHTPENLGKYARIRSFAERHAIRYYPPGRGIAHQVMIEEGFVTPGAMIVASDSHANMYGAIAALGTPVVRTDAAAIWATGETWWQVPPQVRVTLRGRLRPGVTGKDVVLALCARFNSGETRNAAIEFTGDGVAHLTIADRMTIANMTTEWGGLAGLFPFDDRLYRWLLERARALAAHHTPAYTAADVHQWWTQRTELHSDPGASFVREIVLDLASVTPHVTGPNSVTTARPVADLESQRTRIDKAYLMSCVNARLPDFEAAAAVFGDSRRVAPHVRFYIAAASSEVQQQAERSGAWRTLLRAGAIPLSPGCGACIGLGEGTLEPGEVGISATNRNFEGRMGARDADCYLASPAVVAESAIRGHIASPHAITSEIIASSHEAPRTHTPHAPAPSLIDGFPASIDARAILLPLDHINTDAIYDRDVTYRDDLTRAQQAACAMRNYDPDFQRIAHAGDVLIAGHNFGAGSSREQAATALQAFGIRAIIAASLNQTYQRNALNNALITIECEPLVDHLRATIARTAAARTVYAPPVRIDFAASTIECDARTFTFQPLTEPAQRLIVAGGLESLLARRFRQTPEAAGTLA